MLDTIRNLQLQRGSMELFGARTKQPIEICLEEVRKSNILVVIIGHRYGSVVPNWGISYSEAEYEQDFKLNKKCLIYMRDNRVRILPSQFEDDLEKRKLLDNWKDRLQSRHTVLTFRDRHSLATQVSSDLEREIARARAEVTTEGDMPQLTEAAERLLKMSQPERDALFSASRSGPIPDGEAQGSLIVSPGTLVGPAIAEAIRLFDWKGKGFDAHAGFLRNEISRVGMKAILARVYKAPSWLDGKECIVLDYSETSDVASHVRDEIRLVDDRLYLGKVYWDNQPLFDFCLNLRTTESTE